MARSKLDIFETRHELSCLEVSEGEAEGDTNRGRDKDRHRESQGDEAEDEEEEELTSEPGVFRNSWQKSQQQRPKGTQPNDGNP